ncbi:UNVERIFIED_ORG: enoyl-CoA hydratase/isomerase-like protein [Gordonia westfalica J30]
MVPVTEALDRGLGREVVPADQVLERALAVANEMITGTAPVSVALTRSLLWGALGASGPEEAHRAESEVLYRRGLSADVQEGVQAFLDKRAPEFPDRVSGLGAEWSAVDPPTSTQVDPASTSTPRCD